MTDAEPTIDLWALDETALVQLVGRAASANDGTRSRSGSASSVLVGQDQAALAVLQARSLAAAREVAVWTKYLTIATFLLAVVAVVSLIIS
jgi:hypothetical protein